MSEEDFPLIEDGGTASWGSEEKDFRIIEDRVSWDSEEDFWRNEDARTTSRGSDEKDFRIIEDSQAVSQRSFSKLFGPVLSERDYYGIYDLLQGHWRPGGLPSGCQ